MADEDKDVPKTHEAIEEVAEAEDKAGVVDQQAAAERNSTPAKD